MTVSHMKRGLIAAVVAVGFAGVLAGTALATETEVLLSEVAKAAQVEGIAPATETLEVIKQGSKVFTDTGSIKLAVPAGKVTHAASGSIVEGKGDSQVVFQKVADQGYRASVHIASPSDPERYEFKVIGATELQHRFDGSVLAIDAEGIKVAEIQTPWARDANGSEVPTHYEINGTTLTQVVNHQGGDFVYGITADPFWSAVWDGAKCAASIGLAFTPGGKAFAAIKALGGVKKTVKLLAGAGNAKDFLAIAGGAGATILGIDGVMKHCM